MESKIIMWPETKHYKLIADKITSVDDIRLVLKAMNIECYFTEEQARPIKHLLEEVDQKGISV